MQIAADELGLGTDRDLTVTGGMGFAGGPWNNYATHGIATMVDRLRAEPGAIGLCTANGGLTTKHALGLYSTEPPAQPFARLVTQDEADAAPRRDVVGDDHEGPITVEAYTVMHGRDGTREVGFVAGLLADGRRTWCSSNDADLLATLVAEECCGRSAHRRADGTVALA